MALDSRGRYLPWDKVRYLPETGGSQSKARELWFRMKRARRLAYRQLPFSDVNERPFVFCPLDSLNEFQHWMDQQVGGQPGPEQGRQKYILRLTDDANKADEAIHSSQLEGAATTTEDAREMLRKNRKPRTDGEKMIANNYAAMQFIREEAGARKLTPALLLELHDIVTRDTLPASECGSFRRRDNIVVQDPSDGTVLHRPPLVCPAARADRRAVRLCQRRIARLFSASGPSRRSFAFRSGLRPSVHRRQRTDGAGAVLLGDEARGILDGGIHLHFRGG